MFFVFLFYSISFLLSVIGFGFLFIKIVKLEQYTFNVGIIGILGLFFLSIIASYSHIFFAHGYIHNIFLLLLGFALFFYFNGKYRINFKILLTFIDADDIWLKNKLKIQLNLMLKEGQLLSYTAYNVIRLYSL